MAKLYSNEHFPFPAVNLLRNLGHDVLTTQDAKNQGISDSDVMKFAFEEGRAVVTLNRKDFRRLHKEIDSHFGIIVCTDDDNYGRLAKNIARKIAENPDLSNRLLFVYKQEPPF